MLLQKNHLRRNLALLVMLAFVLSLLPLPALAEGETTESHYHSFACYVLTCEETHIHSVQCFATDKEPVCGLEQGAQHNHGGNYDCQVIKVLGCGAEEHQHDETCEIIARLEDMRPGEILITGDDPYHDKDSFGNEYTQPEYIVWPDPDNADDEIVDDGISDEEAGIMPLDGENGIAPLDNSDDHIVDEGSSNEEAGIMPLDGENGIAPLDNSDDHIVDEGSSNEEAGIMPLDGENGVAPLDGANGNEPEADMAPMDDTTIVEEVTETDSEVAPLDDMNALENDIAPLINDIEALIAPLNDDADRAIALNKVRTIKDQYPPLSDAPQLDTAIYSCGKGEHQHGEECYIELYMCRAAETASECTCTYLCTWFWGNYININKSCPVCSHATEEELDPYTYDPEQPEKFICQGKQIVIPGKNASCKHNAVVSGGSLWESWFPGGGSPDLIPATCHSPATNREAIECMDCGAKWLWSFEPASQIDPNAHYYGKNKPIIIQEATCQEDGLQKQTCLFCGDIETVLPGGHVKPTDESQIEYTDNKCREGLIKYQCALCRNEISEIVAPAQHAFKDAVCTDCQVTAYEVYTYEDGATPSGNGYEIKRCARIIQNGDEVYGVDNNGYRLNDDSFAVIINEALMGKTKSTLDENGDAIVTRVAGYRNMDDSNAELYMPGDTISYQDVPAMFHGEKGSWGAYYSSNTYKAIYLKAEREKVDDFKLNIVPYNELKTSQYTRSNISSTSEGITATSEYNFADNTVTITYIIPDGYDEKNIDIDASADIMQAFAKIQDVRWGYNGTQPEDSLGPVFIKIVNNSDNVFTYNKNSFIVQSPDWQGESGYIDPIYTFDGVNPPESAVPSRVSNNALKYLYNVKRDLSNNELTDDVLEEKLIAKGYKNGVQDLHQFYLDYYNNFFVSEGGGNWSTLYEIPRSLLVDRNEGIYGGHSSSAGQKETNPYVAGIGYSYTYTHMYSIVPGDTPNLKDITGAYSVGNYMVPNSAILADYDSNAKFQWNRLKKEEAGILTGMSLYFYGEMNNFYQNTAYNLMVGFSLKEVSPITLTVNKLWQDSEGNEIATPVDKIEVIIQSEEETDNGKQFIEVETLTLGNDTGWKATSKALPRDGKYSIKEIQVDGYTTIYGTPVIDADGNIAITITNKENKPDTATLNITKLWKDTDGNEIAAPEGDVVVTVNVLDEDGAIVATAILSAVNNWSATVNNLPADGKYSVVEEALAGYAAEYSEITGEDNEFFVTITNTKLPPDPISLTVNKVWNDNSSANRPASILVGLSNGESIQEYVTLNADNNWSYTWNELAADVSWSIAEVGIVGYTSTQTREDNVVTITNTLTPPVTPPPGGDNPSDNPPDNPPPTEPNNPTTPPVTPPPGTLTELPDPNVPGAPAEVTVLENDVPLAYVRTWDPETEEYVYVPEEDVPLANMDPVPPTGDNTKTALWVAICLAMLSGMVILTVTAPRRKENK